MRTQNGQKNKQSQHLKRLFLIQIIPFVLMLVVGSWLTLQIGQLIEQQRGEQVQVRLTRF